MRYVIDIDGILCDAPPTYGQQAFAVRKPNLENIKRTNQLFYTVDTKIILYTARKSKDEGVVEVTKQWLKKYGVEYHELRFDKPIADMYIDDHATCNFPEARMLFVVKYEQKAEVMILVYLHTNSLHGIKEIFALPDRYILRVGEDGLKVAAKGEFIRDKDLKEEALFYVQLFMQQLMKTKIIERIVPFSTSKVSGEVEQ